MTDIREQILSQLAVVLARVAGVAKVYRNQVDLDEGLFPAIVMLDADESAADMRISPGRAGGLSPIVVELKPQLFIVLGDAPANVGPSLNALRYKVIKAVMQDAMLLACCQTITGDRIRYESCTTALASGRSMLGEMMLAFTFTYVLLPEQL